MEWALHAVALNPPFGQSRIAMRTVLRQREKFPVHPEDGDICPFNYAAYRLVFDKVVQRTDEVPPQRHGRITHTGITRSVSTRAFRSEEHTSELQSLMRISYAVFCLKKKKTKQTHVHNNHINIAQRKVYCINMQHYVR